MTAQTKPTLTPFLAEGGQVKYRLGSTAAAKKITLNFSELKELRSLIDTALGASHAEAT
jgi:hypothetical protein